MENYLETASNMLKINLLHSLGALERCKVKLTTAEHGITMYCLNQLQILTDLNL